MHPGRSLRARESASTHTGALATDHGVMTALLGAKGVVLVDTIEELIDTAELLARFPLASPGGAAVITNSGAFKGFALDFCAAQGLELAAPAPATLEALRQVLPAFAAIDNPLDTTGQTIKNPEIFCDAAALLLADPAVGSAVVAIVPGSPAQAQAKLDALLPPLSASGKPVALAVMGDEVPLSEGFAASLRRAGVPFFRSPERALRAMAHLSAHAGRRAAAGAIGVAPAPPAPPAIAWPHRGPLLEQEAKAVLAALGIPVPRGALARGLEEARTVAAGIGYPVALKAQSATLLHKSDVGGVILGIENAAALAPAWERLHLDVAAAKPGVTLDGVLVEAMAPRGVEMVVGGRRDPDWGPVVLVGFGGIFVEVLDDVLLVPADLSASEMAAEIGKLKGVRLLRGYRGRPACDVAALADAAARIGALMRACPEVLEIDVNPLLVLAEGHGVMALDALVITAP
jgi:acyl-CoA synthetase (NDP forming)